MAKKAPTVMIGEKECTYRNLVIEDMIAYCKANNCVEWLKAKVHEQIDGRDITFIEIKRDFCREFIPEFVSGKSSAKKDMKALVDAL